jgi:hypothetical protein
VDGFVNRNGEHWNAGLEELRPLARLFGPFGTARALRYDGSFVKADPSAGKLSALFVAVCEVHKRSCGRVEFLTLFEFRAAFRVVAVGHQVPPLGEEGLGCP